VLGQSTKVEFKVKSIEIKAVSEPLVSGEVLDSNSTKSRSKIKWAVFFVRYTIKAPKTQESVLFDSGTWADTLELDWQMAYKAKKGNQTIHFLVSWVL
jgi:hypothetical protein